LTKNRRGWTENRSGWTENRRGWTENRRGWTENRRDWFFLFFPVFRTPFSQNVAFFQKIKNLSPWVCPFCFEKKFEFKFLFVKYPENRKIPMVWTLVME
jgi:hypothetical protein